MTTATTTRTNSKRRSVFTNGLLMRTPERRELLRRFEQGRRFLLADPADLCNRRDVLCTRTRLAAFPLVDRQRGGADQTAEVQGRQPEPGAQALQALGAEAVAAGAIAILRFSR